MVKASNFEIKLITSQETIPVRHPVLREGRPIETCVFENDDLMSTQHLGLFFSGKLAGVATFLESKNQLFKEVNQYQLRGMAVLKAHQGRGFGEAILEYGEQLLKKENNQLIWFNARTIAVGFYEKNNYKIIGEPFEISGVGTHHIMYKAL